MEKAQLLQASGMLNQENGIENNLISNNTSIGNSNIEYIGADDVNFIPLEFLSADSDNLQVNVIDNGYDIMAANGEDYDEEEPDFEDLRYEYFNFNYTGPDGEFLYISKARKKRIEKRKEKKIARAEKKAAKKQKRIEKKIEKAEKKGKTKKVGRLERKSTKVETKRKKKIEKAKTKAEKKQKPLFKRLGQKLKTVFPGLVASRGAYLGLIRLNAFGFATKINNIKKTNNALYTKIRDKWYGLGGNRTKFDDAVEKGAKKKPLLSKVKSVSGADGSHELYFIFEDNPEYFYPTGLEEAASLLVAAAPIIAAFASLIGKPKEMDDATSKALEAEAKLQNEQFQKQLAYEQENPLPENKRDTEPELSEIGETNIPIWGWVAIGVAVIGVIGTVTYFMTKKKT